MEHKPSSQQIRKIGSGSHESLSLDLRDKNDRGDSECEICMLLWSYIRRHSDDITTERHLIGLLKRHERYGHSNDPIESIKLKPLYIHLA